MTSDQVKGETSVWLNKCPVDPQKASRRGASQNCQLEHRFTSRPCLHYHIVFCRKNVNPPASRANAGKLQLHSAPLSSGIGRETTGTGEGEGAGIGEGVGAGEGAGAGEGTGVGTGVGEGTGVGVGTGEGTGVGVGVGVGVGIGIGVDDGAGVGDGVGVGDGAGDGEGVGVGDGTGVGELEFEELVALVALLSRRV